jgi:dienelactone hydrolase
MRLFVDRTRQPGPSTWQAGSYPDGDGDHPVGGVSWYEAAAYARFAGKRLPTYWHWRQGHSVGLVYVVVPRSNLASTGGPAPVGSYKGLGAFGTYDQAGNLREWVYNERAGQRLIMGGAWSDPDWLTLMLVTASPWDRLAINGFRLARYPEDTPALSKAHDPVPTAPRREYEKERPASPREVEIFKRLYSYDPLPLDPRLERADSARDWIRERVSFTPAYGTERMAVYLYLPRRSQPPYQTVIYWPGSQVLDHRRIEQKNTAFDDFFVKTGRALVLPLYLGTFDRDDEQFSLAQGSLGGFASSRFRDLTIQWVKDLRRSIDYLATRPDIDTTRLAYYGYSWGAWMAPLSLVVEPRIKAGISYAGGLWSNTRFMPEIDPFNFLGAVRAPFLMLASRYDPIFPFETSQKQMYDLLGTPPEDKKLFVYDGGPHYMPADIVARESLAWLDRYLGPVRFVP